MELCYIIIADPWNEGSMWQINFVYLLPQLFKDSNQDTQYCASGQENKRRVAHKCVIYWYHEVAKFSLPYLQNYYIDFYQIYALHIHYFTYQN